MTVKGTNFRERKARLSRAYLLASEVMLATPDLATMKACRDRKRSTKLAWQRLDDHIYPKGIRHAAR